MKEVKLRKRNDNNVGTATKFTKLWLKRGSLNRLVVSDASSRIALQSLISSYKRCSLKINGTLTINIGRRKFALQPFSSRKRQFDSK